LKVDAIASTAKTIQAVSRFIGEVRAYNPEYTILHCENRLELQIGYGDVLDWPGPGAIALACDNRFDAVKHGEGSQLYERTLIGQFRRRFLNHLSTDDFRKHMVTRLGGSKLDDRFEVGHVSATPLVGGATGTPDRRMLFLVVLHTVMDRSGVIEAAADALDVWRAYESLWKAVSRQRPEAVAAPLFGPGQSGTLLSRQQSCVLAVLSAVCVALRQPIYPRLRLLCHDRDSYRALNLRAIAEAAGLERGPRT
jgi:Thoeris protein ThsA, Macro domain